MNKYLVYLTGEEWDGVPVHEWFIMTSDGEYEKGLEFKNWSDNFFYICDAHSPHFAGYEGYWIKL